MRAYIAILIFLLSLYTPYVGAVKVASIYQATIPVASQSEQEKTQAERQAFTIVLIKVSGNSHIIDNPAIKSHISDVGSLVQEFTYSSANQLTVRFDSTEINRILQEAKAPIWGTNRPLILVWATYAIPGQAPAMVDNGEGNDIQSLFKQYAEQRGLPIIFPVMDMADVNQVSANDIVNITLPVLQTASKRYAPDAMLVMRLIKVDNNHFSLQAKLIMDTLQWDWAVSSENMSKVMDGLANNIADTLAARYATLVSSTVQTQLSLLIKGISQPNDFAQLMEYLKHLPAVAEIEPVRVEGNEVLLKISLRGSSQSLIQALSIGQKLRLIESHGENEFVYQWNP